MFGILKQKHKISFNILICVEKDGESYHAFVPNLKGIHVDGDTKQEAIENAKRACVLYIKSLIAHEEPIPLQHVQPAEVCSPATAFGRMLTCPIPQSETIYVNA